MKNVFLLGLGLLLLSCNDHEGAAEETVPTETTDATADPGVVAPEPMLTLTGKGVGEFLLNEPLPSPGEVNGFMVKKEKRERFTEEGPVIENIYVVSNDGKELMQLQPGFDYETGNENNMIGEIRVTSEEVRTAEGIGVGSTLAEFLATYPDHKIWYTYVSGMYVIETPVVPAQFLLDEKGFTGKDIVPESEITSLQTSDFKENTRIQQVRMFSSN